MTFQKTVYLVSLGCAKNRVDSEVMLGYLVNDGYEIVSHPQEATVIIINTCGFIASAKQESIDTILEMARYKTAGKAKYLIVTGCLSQRYAKELQKEIPEIDYLLGTGNFIEIAKVLRKDIVRKKISKLPPPVFTLNANTPRLRTLALHYSYVKVSEGCSNKCAFCAIPFIRGAQCSRTVADVMREVEQLLASDCVEINLLAQNLCAYGHDLTPKQNLVQLLHALDKLGSEREHYWIRCLYLYPRGLTKELIDTIASSKHVLKYIDIPLQHIADPILRRMHRGKGGAATWDLIRVLRKAIPGLVLRTTFITGLPYETADDFKQLCDFVREIKFEHMGVFTFSPEEGTAAATMKGQVPAELALNRRDKLMSIQQKISKAQQKAMLGKTIEVLVDGISDESDMLLQGRHQGQAPEVDGVTYITSGTAKPGDIVNIVVDQVGDYDVAGEIL
ncbi:MAG: 30S ribosomal protein S12 methylthiotransferase RimO [Deltaproteobacteria bacterium]|nr:30S ribosomal protein S12 methylthiotransferase RimO [Deltaproteobacteria bacterium]